MSGHTVTPLPSAPVDSAKIASVQMEALPSALMKSTSEAFSALPTMITKKLQNTYQESFSEALGTGTVFSVSRIAHLPHLH